MTNRLPRLLKQEKICIICEGAEEYEYLDTLKKLNVWSKEYLVDLENADGNGNIPARYQDKYQNGSYDVVLIFCDTDKKPYEQYEDIKRKINEFHDKEIASDLVVIFGNPCTMQIEIMHWTDIKLKSSAKKVNASVIESCTGVENYKGKAEQRKAIYQQITQENYYQMLTRIEQLPEDDYIINSCNFGRFMKFLMSDNAQWIQDINSKIE